MQSAYQALQQLSDCDANTITITPITSKEAAAVAVCMAECESALKILGDTQRTASYSYPSSNISKSSSKYDPLVQITIAGSRLPSAVRHAGGGQGAFVTYVWDSNSSCVTELTQSDAVMWSTVCPFDPSNSGSVLCPW